MPTDMVYAQLCSEWPWFTVLVTGSNLLLSSNQYFEAEPLFIFTHWRHWPMMERLCYVHMG